MSKNLPVPLRPGRVAHPARESLRPEVIVLDAGMPARRQAHPLARLALGLAPDILRAVERSLAQRPAAEAGRVQLERGEPRSRASGFQFSEVEYDVRMPFVRKVTVRKANAWSADLPQLLLPMTETRERGGGLRRAGVVGIGALALAALGLLANRAGGLPGLGGRR